MAHKKRVADAPRPLAISYARVSSPEQVKKHGIQRQTERADEYARRMDLRRDDSLLDDGVSAFRGKHRSSNGALKRFVDRVEAGEIPEGTHLIVESLDRLSREEVFEALTFFLQLIRLGLVIVTLGDGERVYSRETVRDDPAQLMMSLLVMMRAHEESAMKSDRVGRAWAAKRERARETKQAMTARCPAWIHLVGGPRTGRYELVPERAEVVREIFRRTIDGVGRRTIARGLNADGVAPWGGGAMWHDSYVEKLLSNPAAYGAFTPRGRLAGGTDDVAEPIEGYFPAAVDEETFRRAQAASRARGSRTGGTSRMYRNLLRGIAKCAECGATMVYLDKGMRSKGPVLKCGRAHAAAGCGQRVPYSYRFLETGVLVGLRAKSGELTASATSERARAAALAEAANARLDEARKRHDTLLDLREHNVTVPIERLQRSSVEMASLKEAAARAEEAVERAKLSDPGADIGGLTAIFRALEEMGANDRAQARAAMHEKLKRMIDHIDVAPNGYLVHYADGTTTRGVRM